MIFGKAINKYYIKNLHWFLIGIAALIAIDYVQLEIPRIISEIVGGLTPDVDTNMINYDVATLVSQLMEIVVFVGYMLVGRFLWRICIFGASRRFDYGIRNDMFEHSEKLSNKFYSENKTGGLMAHFTNDVETVRRAVGPGMIMLVDALFLGTLAIIRMVQINPMLTLVSAIPLSLIAVVGTILGNKMRIKFKEAQKAFEDLSDYTTESLGGINVIKAFVKEKIELREFLKRNQTTKDKNIEFVKMQATLQISVRSIVSIIFVVIIGFTGYLVKAGEMNLQEFSYFFLVFSTLIWPMMALAMIINIRSRGKASLERITKILDEEIDIFDAYDVQHIEEIEGKIEFKNLTFTYPDGSEPVLKDISFTINKGETVGILGRTGSGKTSIVDLLLRLYNIEEQSLFIDDIDIMKLPLVKVRDSIGYVPQDGFLFSDSISKNISLSFGKQENLFEEVQTAARLSDVHDNIIEFTEGYETIIGERGVTLSGGQRQRLSIARALIKNPPIMVLDDSVSAVDTKTEETILNNLEEIRSNRTTIIIAHRISTLKTTDKIIIVDDGKILDIGSHEELLARCAFYQDMVERQKLEDEIEVR